MSGKRQYGLWREQVPVKLQSNGSKVEIPVSVYARPSTANIESYWALGFGAGSMAVRNVVEAQRQFQLGGSAIILPYHKVPYQHMEGFTNEAIPQVVEALSGRRGVKAAGDSRGAGALGRAIGHAPELFTAAGLLEPSFLTTMGDKPSKSVAQLLYRLAILNPPRLRNPVHPGVIQTGIGIAKEIVTIGVTQGPANLKKAVELVVDPGVVERTVESIGRAVDEGVAVRIWPGSRDRVFPPQEIASNLKPAGLDYLATTAIGVPHVAMGSPEGYEEALRIASFMKSPSFPAPQY
jgi:hypothetical protein